MKNLKISKLEKTNLKEKKKMKKLISSVLVFALMGVPVVSGAFADKAEHEEAVSRIIKLIEEANSQGNIEAAKNYSNALKILLAESDKLAAESDKAEKKIDENEINENLLRSQIDFGYETDSEEDQDAYEVAEDDVDYEDEEDIEKAVDPEEKTEKEQVSKVREDLEKSMSTAKKILIATGVAAALAGAGYAAYNYCPAVQSFVNDKTLPFLQGCVSTVRNFVTEKFISPVCDSFGSTPDEKLSECQRQLIKCNSSKITFSDKMMKFMLGETVFFLGSLSNNFLIGSGAGLAAQLALVKLAFF